MPFAWFGVVVASIVVDLLCHLHGFGQSWLELLWISDAICMFLVVVARIVVDLLCHLHGFGQSWLAL